MPRLLVAVSQLSFSKYFFIFLTVQVNSSHQSHGHSQSPQTADRYHCHRNWSSGASLGETAGAWGGSDGSHSQSWGHCRPQGGAHSWRRLEANAASGSLEDTWVRDTWVGAGTAAGSAGRTSCWEVSEPGEREAKDQCASFRLTTAQWLFL